jgi:transposase
MSSAIEIVRLELSAAQLRAAARKMSDNKQARRVLAIAMVLEGHARQVAAQAGAMDRQTLRDWVHRYNAHGLDGLVDQPRSGRRPRLTKAQEAQEAELARWVIEGPDPKVDGVVPWRCVDLRDRIAARFEVELHERTIGKLLDKLGFSSLSVRPLHREADLEAQETFRKTLRRARAGRDPAKARWPPH